MPAAPDSIALVGFGEVGQILTKNFRAGGVKDIRAWDTGFADPASPQAAAAASLGVAVAQSAHEALSGAPLVISCVTAGSAEAAARTAAQRLAHGAIYADVNSVSPGTKMRIGETVEAIGARFVEVAIMSPIKPRGLASPMLLGGQHAAAFRDLMSGFKTDMSVVEGPIGRAAATKMCRSVMYKGLEALFLESMISARHYRVEKEVLASLVDTFDRGWPETARYMISRALIHGRRRAEEMREAAKTVAEAGLPPLVTEQVAARQDWAADRAAGLVGINPTTAELRGLLDALADEIAAATK